MTSGIRQAVSDDFLSHEDYEYYKERLPLYFAQVSLWAYHMEDGGLAGFAGVAYGNAEILFVDADFRGQGWQKQASAASYI